jgi:hypothetical protein
MKIGTTMFTIKFKDKIPCENEATMASDLAYYLHYLEEIPDELIDWKIEDLDGKRDIEEIIFTDLSREYSNLFKEYALIKLKANELYQRNRTIALTAGILRQKLMSIKDHGTPINLDVDKSIEIVENFIYRYITKKQDDRLIEQIVFEEK